MDEPRLTPEFGHKPAGLDGDEAKHTAGRDRSQQPAPWYERRPPSPPGPPEPGTDEQHGEAAADHHIERQVRHRLVWPVGGRDGIEPGNGRIEVSEAEQTQALRDLDRVFRFATEGEA